jgi:hypothetical protein
MFDELHTCPVNDQHRPCLQLDYIDQLRFNHQERVRDEATEKYIEEFLATGDHEFAKHVYFNHLHLYL